MPQGASRGPPLGRLAATRGTHSAVYQRFEVLARKSWFTRRISVLLPLSGLDEESVRRLAARLQLQRLSYRLHKVPLVALGSQPFAKAIDERQICCLSRGVRGLDAGNCLAVFPPAQLVAAVMEPAYQRLGLEEPAPGTQQLEKKLLPSGQHHVCVDLHISKSRAKKAAAAREQPVSFWQAKAPREEVCDLLAYCGNEINGSYDFAPLVALGAETRSEDMPVTCKRFQLAAREMPVKVRDAASPGQKAPSVPRPPLEQLVGKPSVWSEDSNDLTGGEAYGEACEDLLDWLGALHMGIEPAGMIAAEPCCGALWQVSSQVKQEEVLLWTMGESLMGPTQVLHALRVCQEALGGQAPWFMLSIWGAEDAPISHHGGAHSFDLTGSHHAHLLAMRSNECLLLEAANSLHSNA
eukprot:TRINITY_DN77043_c0_g1_i1.p1 TRINITY_DN77043_c0_g1~~TRINITY_DN77043_c0_g1_i1.p1  ORF type:complete len:409 (+),score=61.78 TRINITY_DN77043_c0_g1_i1:74-1300(+)